MLILRQKTGEVRTCPTLPHISSISRVKKITRQVQRDGCWRGNGSACCRGVYGWRGNTSPARAAVCRASALPGRVSHRERDKSPLGSPLTVVKNKRSRSELSRRSSPVKTFHEVGCCIRCCNYCISIRRRASKHPALRVQQTAHAPGATKKLLPQQ